ncbi:protein of unknown function [Candidatus Filomicrobium marinum]|uniref:Uncharacterized protein n=1 Tax=Candidatus Filomicrobium marinum TaxID=1608628 RepID=A0A0D6JHG1_9HYPH|nr:protein of unknown function [Candidatus Filomicrobium marinum]CPR20898.1 protein of unknown function [Candidatus Filomicrobium marinum]
MTLRSPIAVALSDNHAYVAVGLLAARRPFSAIFRLGWGRSITSGLQPAYVRRSTSQFCGNLVFMRAKVVYGPLIQS